MYSSLCSTYTSMLYKFFVVSFGVTRMFLSIMLPLKYVWMPYILQMFLIVSQRSCIYGKTIYPLDFFDGSVLLLVMLLLLLLGLFCWKFLCSILPKANVGYLHLAQIFLRCCSVLAVLVWNKLQ